MICMFGKEGASHDAPETALSKAMKGVHNMATVEYKSADYQIGASASQEFTFWWGEDSLGPSEYFDVSIGPDFDPNYPPQRIPLVEVQRAYLLDQSEKPTKDVLVLTLRNDNDFPVYFTANHIRIYN
jgi:hypothetical protein